MSDVVSTFPLLRLPKNAVMNTLELMNYLQIYGISILSKNTKNLVESSNITVDFFQVEVADKFEIELFLSYDPILHFELYHVRENQPLQEVGTPESLHIQSGITSVTWTNAMSVKQLLDHLEFIFHSPITTLYFQKNCERFNFESVQKNVKNFKNVFLLSGNHEHSRKLLGLFQPTSLMLGGDIRADERIPSDFLIQNFDVFYHAPNVRITLDELLIANSRVIDLVCQELSVNIINQLLKLWVKGSNPRLECLLLWFVPNFRNEELLKGLKVEAASCNRMRLFNSSAEKKIENVYGGWDISRCDGPQVTQPLFYPVAFPHSFTYSGIMDDVVSTFPLLRLPINAILNTFRTIHPRQIFGISLLSKKTKNLVESTKITTWNLQVQVTDNFKINLLFPYHSTLNFKFNQVLENEPLQELDSPGNYQIALESKWVTWTNTMSVKELLDHLKFIFHSHLATLSFGENCERFSLESIHKNVKDFKNIYLLSGNHEHNRKLLGMFQPISLMVGSDALVNLSIPKDILIQNFNVIHFVPNLRISLDELLMANSRIIDFVCRELSVSIINQFLKLWVKGSNPRLECLLLWLVPNFRTEELFKGLNYTNVPCNTERLFNSSAEKKIEKLVEGWDIWRCDGTRATIILHRFQSVVFKLFVWHDHCIVD